MQHLRGLRPSDLEHVGGRPDGGAVDQAFPLRLAAAGQPGQRPSDFFEGARLPSAVLDGEALAAIGARGDIVVLDGEVGNTGFRLRSAVKGIGNMGTRNSGAADVLIGSQRDRVA
jgi:hypothetical protein